MGNSHLGSLSKIIEMYILLTEISVKVLFEITNKE